MRRTEQLEDIIWKEIDFMDLRTGDTFRFFDEGANPYEDGSKTYMAFSDPYISEETGVGTIQCEEITNEDVLL